MQKRFSDSSLEDYIPSYREYKNRTMTQQESVQIDLHIRNCLAEQAQIFDQKIATLTEQLNALKATAPEVTAYKPIEIIPEVRCEEPLDIVKSIPEFDGKQEHYISWRQAANAAYKVFEAYDGSSRHYQAVAIIRNKVRGSADAILASFNTVLNFHAIIARLDFTYSDKTPVHVIQQDLSTLRQGDQPLLKYYDEIERKLTLLTNKTLMTHDAASAAVLNDKYRNDALHTFISGLKKSLKWAVFPAQPRDLQTALALAQEAESSNERSIFAANFARHIEEKAQKSGNQRSQGSRQNSQQESDAPTIFRKNPHYQKGNGQKPNTSGSARQRYYQKPQESTSEPMEVDTSSRFRQPTQATNFKGGHSAKSRQSLNHMPQDQKTEYEEQAESEANAAEDDLSEVESCNFLGVTPCFRTSHVQ